ncbi:MAG: hypothetical protein KME20_00300 [Kaiparowitsia implicata GSE-PSE-MK54-09C]|nr:hypothetical protein [Kaiparowitsia implicata GSE-PSE-MK54-09C]
MPILDMMIRATVAAAQFLGRTLRQCSKSMSHNSLNYSIQRQLRMAVGRVGAIAHSSRAD